MKNLFVAYCESKNSCETCPLNDLMFSDDCEKAFSDIAGYYHGVQIIANDNINKKIDNINSKLDKVLSKYEDCEGPEIKLTERMFL